MLLRDARLPSGTVLTVAKTQTMRYYLFHHASMYYEAANYFNVFMRCASQRGPNMVPSLHCQCRCSATPPPRPPPPPPPPARDDIHVKPSIAELHGISLVAPASASPATVAASVVHTHYNRAHVATLKV